MRKEEHFTIKRVERLPRKGNLNILYILRGNSIDRFYKAIGNGDYEEITIGSGDQDNIARVIVVTSEDIAEGLGETLEDKIAEYVNTLSYEKLATDAEIWIDYQDLGVQYTAFNVSSITGEACFAPDLSPFDNTLYHDGEGVLPVTGDTVFTDIAGTTPFVTSEGEDYQVSDLTYLETDANGVRQDIFCK